MRSSPPLLRRPLPVRQPQLPLRGLARKALWDTVMISGLAFVEDELEVERVALCGQRYEHQAGRQALRSGHVRQPPDSYMPAISSRMIPCRPAAQRELTREPIEFVLPRFPEHIVPRQKQYFVPE